MRPPRFLFTPYRYLRPNHHPRPHHRPAMTRSAFPTFAALLLVMAGSVMAPAGVAAQLASFGGAIQEADMLYLAGQPELALDVVRQEIARDSANYDALWRATRSSVVIGLEVEDNREQNLWLDPAIDWARRAVEIDSAGIDGRYWRGVAAGRRAMNAGPGYAVELAQIVYDDSHAILAVDSLHGGAHNMLGKLNYEIMMLSRIKRAVARTFMGNDALNDTSWEHAEYHLARAAELWPDFILFHFDLGQLYRKRGPREEAIASYQRALALPAVQPIDLDLQEQARAQLEDWGAATVSLRHVRPPLPPQ